MPRTFEMINYYEDAIAALTRLEEFLLTEEGLADDVQPILTMKEILTHMLLKNKNLRTSQNALTNEMESV